MEMGSHQFEFFYAPFSDHSLIVQTTVDDKTNFLKRLVTCTYSFGDYYS